MYRVLKYVIDNVIYSVLLSTVFFLCAYGYAIASNSDVFIEIENPLVYSISVDEDIRAGTLQFVERSIKNANSLGADVFILNLNTSGGLLSATEDISRVLIDSSIPVVVYVDKDTGRAFSAGTFIVLSADIAVVHPNASIGATTPILSSGEEAGDKVVNATNAWLKSLAERKGRDVDSVLTFTVQNSTLRGIEALDAGVIDMVAEDIDSLLVNLGVNDPTIHKGKPTVVDNILSFLSIPYLVPLFLTIGSLGLFVSFRTGEIQVLGVFSFLLLLLGLWGAGSIQLSTLGVVVLLVGVLFIVLEIFLNGSDFGVSGVLGTVALVFGFAMFAQEPYFHDIFSYGLAPFLFAILVSGVGIMFGLSYATAKIINMPHKVGSETMIGREAVVWQDIDPEGVIKIDGERYTARLKDGAEKRILKNTGVEITNMEGNIAIVKELE